jgi:hypothetical protein
MCDVHFEIAVYFYFLTSIVCALCLVQSADLLLVLFVLQQSSRCTIMPQQKYVRDFHGLL